MRGRLRAIGRVALLLGCAGCGSALVGVGAGYDAGTLGVSGVETGTGVQLEVVGYRGADGSGLGLGPALAIAGYTTDGDGDPIAFTTLELRYRRRLRPGARSGLYWGAGTGAGAAWSPALTRAALPLQGEVGVSTAAGRLLLSLGVRERFLALLGSGSPPTDASNSLQLVLGLGLGAERAR
jgi:hypothetical protein